MASGTGIMPSQDRRWRENYAFFVRLYKGRQDVIAERRDGEYVELKGSGLTFERFIDHVQMKSTYAIFNKDDDGCVNFGLFDVDVFPRDQGWDKLLLSMDEKKGETLRIMQILGELGLRRENMLVEFPTVGYHLLIFFERPVPGKTLKNLMRFVLKTAGLERIPIYPTKMDATYGDRVQLPLRINLNTGRRSNLVRDLPSFDPLNYPSEPDFSLLADVVPIPAEWVDQMSAKYELK